MYVKIGLHIECKLFVSFLMFMHSFKQNPFNFIIVTLCNLRTFILQWEMEKCRFYAYSTC
jgi:hypothetical protein